MTEALRAQGSRMAPRGQLSGTAYAVSIWRS
jgi:hypothetical protein